jgi:hypothetical protein
MIDYEKLKIAHELAKQSDKEFYISVDFHTNDKFSYNLFCYPNECDCWESYKTLDELIHGLRYLNTTQPKYNIGQEVFTLHGNDIHSFIIDEITHDDGFWYLHYVSNGIYMEGSKAFDQYREDMLYPSKESLIEAQIQYWCSQLDMKQEIEFWADRSKCAHEVGEMTPQMLDGRLFCIKCGENLIKDNIREPEIKTSAFDATEALSEAGQEKIKAALVEMIGIKADARCEHESDGNIYTSKPPYLKCKKCGEFYR